jgi:Zn-dependent protease with chaperone function/Zn-finger nucleic acid-binding protein
MSISPRRPDFYEVQSRQWRISLLYASVLFAAYLLIFSLLALFVLVLCDILPAGLFELSWPLLARVLLGTTVAALGLAGLQFISTRRSGASFILKRLGAQEPDRSDRYHARFLNIVEEMRIAAGLPRTKAYLLPFLAMNCMALVEADGTPAVVATEGLLAECSREELQAAAAHELAHILKGDVFYITLLCSLADFFERLADKLTPEDSVPAGAFGQAEAGAAQGLSGWGARGMGALAASLSGGVLRLLSLLVSREREILADAAAVELCRDPAGLARVLYKARLKNTFVGDFRLTYNPLFMVSSDPATESDGLPATLFSTHPPLEKRIALLAAMAGQSTDDIIEQIWNSQKTRDQAKRLKLSNEELERLRPPEAEKTERPAAPAEGEDRPWQLRAANGVWSGPLTAGELVSHPQFSPSILVRNDQEGVEARAGEFPAVRATLRRFSRRQLRPASSGEAEKCPRCRIVLADDCYEGVAVKFCRACRGRLVPASGVDRILARKEFAFSENLVRKAADFKKTVLRNPLVAEQKAGRRPFGSLLCPRCGARMVSRPFNYQYFIPVDKCLSCYQIWFDADELEMLQILVEQV